MRKVLLMPNSKQPVEEVTSNVEPTVAPKAIVVDGEEYTKVKEITIKELGEYKDPRIIPSFTRAELAESLENVDKDKLKSMSGEMRGTYYLNSSSEDYIMYEDALYRKPMGNNTNEPTSNDVSLVMKALSSKKRAKNKKAALMKLGQRTGIGSMVHIPLWNSGFWVTINPLNNEEIISLEMELINEISRIGKATNLLVFSNHSVLFEQVIFKYFLKKLENTSLILDGENIEDYIKAPDLHLIAVGMAKSMYPRGFQAVIPCRNNVILDENKLPTCEFKSVARKDLNELVWVDGDKLTLEQKAFMENKSPNSVSIEDVVKYQQELECAMPITRTYKSEIDDDEFDESDPINIVLSVPSASRHFRSGDLFITELRDKAIELVKNSDQLSDVKQAEELLLKSVNLKLYNSYIDSMPIDDAVLTELADINDALIALNSNLAMSTSIMKDISSFIAEATLTTVGAPNFTCPKCNTEQTDKSIIPLAVYEYFFILLHSRYTKITNQLEKQQKS